MMPPPWMIDELEKSRREREDAERPQLWIEQPLPAPARDERSQRDAPREPIVIELW